jgi:predicted nuclease of predicted toxin-antitoxin system
MRCLVDEHMHVRIAEVLRRRGHDVIHVAQSDWRHSPDEDLWDLAQREERILITLDLDFPLRDRGTIAGLLLLRFGRVLDWEVVIARLEEFLDTERIESVLGNIVVLRPGRLRSHPWANLHG